MGQSGDVEAYLPHQATNATGKCSCPLPEGIEGSGVEGFFRMRDTGNTLYSDVVRKERCRWGVILYVVT